MNSSFAHTVNRSSNKWMNWIKKTRRTFVCLALFLLFRVCTDRLLLFVVRFTWIYHFNIFLAETQIPICKECTFYCFCFFFFFIDSFVCYYFVSVIANDVNRHFFQKKKKTKKKHITSIAHRSTKFISIRYTEVYNFHARLLLPINNAPNVCIFDCVKKCERKIEQQQKNMKKSVKQRPASSMPYKLLLLLQHIVRYCKNEWLIW